MKVVLCQEYFNSIGGVETFIINFCKNFYKKYDITLLCRTIEKETALELSQYADIICEPDEDEEINCDICIISSVLVDKEMFKHIRYKKVYQMIHSDWTEMKNFWNWEFYKIVPDLKYISVSEVARASFLKEYGEDSIVIPNILYKENVDTRKSLRLLSLTRLTEEKGYERMKELCDLLEQFEIPYIWDVYGTNPLGYGNYKNMLLHAPIKGDKSNLIKSYDYIVQLSSTESFCYSLYESLMYGVPVLATPFPNAKKEIKDGENGYILPFNMKINKQKILDIYNKIPQNVKYEQTGVKEKWMNVLK